MKSVVRPNRFRLSRRTLLKGLGQSTIALPFLEAMSPLGRRACAQTQTQVPRLIYLWFDLGVYENDWVPTGSGNTFQLPSILSGLLGYRSDITLVKHIANHYGDGHGEGPGDHARSIGTFLTCAHHRRGDKFLKARCALPRDNAYHPPAGTSHGNESNYPDLITGSADILASRLDAFQRFPIHHLQIANTSGGDGYHGDVRRHLSWENGETPAVRYSSLSAAFDLLFQQQGQTTESRDLTRSILDPIPEQVQSLRGKVSAQDLQTLERYFEEIRELEKQLTDVATNSCDWTGFARPGSEQHDFRNFISISNRLLVKAFECDLTRVAAVAWPYGNFGFLKDAQGRAVDQEPHNAYSHHGGNGRAIEGLRAINRYWVTQFVNLLDQLKNRLDPDGLSMLYNSAIMFGCGMRDGNQHDSSRALPIILAGHAGGRWRPGRAIDRGQVRLADIHLETLQKVGFRGTSFGDSKGHFAGL